MIAQTDSAQSALTIMQRSLSQGLPILFERPTYEWVARVNQKQKELDSLELPAEARKKIDRWADTEFVYSTMKLEGFDIQRKLVARIASSQTALDDSTEVQSARNLFDSLRTVTSAARSQGKDAPLSVELLYKLNGASDARDVRSPGDASSGSRPENLQLIIDSALQWFSAESFAELHPVEQASIVFLRLIELRPFDKGNERTALVAAGLFTQRSGLPPIIIEPETQPAYRAALSEGLRMSTKPMVEFVAASVERSLTRMIAAIGGEPTQR